MQNVHEIPTYKNDFTVFLLWTNFGMLRNLACRMHFQKQKRSKSPPAQETEKKVYNLRERTPSNFMNLEPPDDDHFLCKFL